MRRVFLALIPLALIAVGVLWPLVIRPGAEASDASDPVVFSNYDVDFIVSEGGRLDAVETITARVPQRTPRPLQVLGGRQPEQLRRTSDARGHLDPARRPMGALPDAVGGRRAVQSGQDRRSGPVPQRRHARVRDPLQHRRRPGPRDHRRGQDIRRLDRRSRRIAVRVLLERHRPGVEQLDPTRRHLGHHARRDRPGAVFGRLRRRCGLRRPDRHRQQGRVVGVEPASRAPR